LKAHIFIDVDTVIAPLDRRIYGQFIEHLGRCIYGGVWVGGSSRIPNVNGYRVDVLEAVRKIKPPLVRWPGGNFASGYHWEDGIGPRDKRPRMYDMAWGAEEPNEFGTDEYIEWVRMIGSEPFITVNAGNGSPDEAAHWVEYCNSTKDTRYAQLRKKYGHKEPYNVKLWSIGNELYGSWQIGFCRDGEECGRRTLEFANEMKKVDPDIKLVGVGTDQDPEWNIEMVRVAGEYLDYLSIHTYVITDRAGKTYDDLVAWPTIIEENLRHIYYTIVKARKKYNVNNEIKLAFDEWNVWHPEAQPPLLTQMNSIKDAIFTGLVLNSLQRMVKIVPIACFAQTINVLPLIITDDEGNIVLTPQYLVYELYTEAMEGNVVSTSVISPSYISKEHERPIPYLDSSAVYKPDEKTTYLYVVNKNRDEPIDVEIHIKGADARTVRHRYVSGQNVDDKNTFETPRNVRIEEKEYKLDLSKTIRVPAHSVNLLFLR